MKKLVLLCTATLIFAFVGCKDNKKSDDLNETKDTVVETTSNHNLSQAPKTVTVMLEPKSDSKAEGEAHFSEKNGMVTLEAKFTGLKPGTHAIHLHEKADCSAADASSAGGHWNPTHQKHGKWGDKDGYHKGDIGNLEADENGYAAITMTTDEWCIGCGDENKDILGKAVIVHQDADDFVSQPTGNAGGRVACGGVIK
ncbi:superoxide dismutase family protein [Aequorivita sp. H23M31]|uniref:Superoxide dismutase [Cu-Zn] n=1 Tax=Aequorivita ciconiae TaxID=2494375 RepID=A0A410FZC7_9FLAO|nr:superoxide dismutase family protein [Aequorivita sp. H23M31]QAA80356.1 superoxide dismutase family protein [Aequorivita sp. H23M31]